MTSAPEPTVITHLALDDVTAANVDAARAQLLAHATTLREVQLVQKGYKKPLDLTAFPWHTLTHLRTLTLGRMRVPASLLAHPALESLHLTACPIGAADAVHVGAQLQSLDLVDCNSEVATLHLDSTQLTRFALSLDEDAAESNFSVIRLACPALKSLRFRSALSVELQFVGAFPAVAAADLHVEAGAFGGPVLDVTQADSAVLAAAAARFGAT